MTNVIDMPGMATNTSTGTRVIEPDEKVCQNCFFSVFEDSAEIGSCRESSPVPLIVPTPQRTLQGDQLVPVLQSVFPPVQGITFCFKFKTKKPQPAVASE